MASTAEFPPLKIETSEKFGRYLVAQQNVKKGDCILKEAPLVVFPILAPIEEKDRAVKTICTTCNRLVHKDFTLECNKCKWPFCNRCCEPDPYHRAMECELFRVNGISWSRERSRQLYLVRSFILKTKDSAKWDQMMNLESNYGKENPRRIHFNKLATEAAKEFFADCNINVDTNEIEKHVRLFEINSFCLSVNYKPSEDLFDGHEKFGGLYAKSSLFAHSCAPNVEFMQVNLAEDRRSIGFYAMNDIKEGEMLTTSYTNDFIYQGTKERRNSLYNVLSFVCGCARCSDPTELGTYYSSLKCLLCDDGWLCPSDSLTEYLYKCNKCWFYIATSEAEIFEGKFKGIVRDLAEKSLEERQKHLDWLVSPASCVYRLHPNHHLVIEATETWLSLVDLSTLLDSSAESEELYLAILERARRVLTIQRTFGMAAKQTQLEALISSAILRYEFKSTTELPVIKDFDSPGNKETKIKKIIVHFRQSIDPRISEFGDSEELSFLEDMEKKY